MNKPVDFSSTHINAVFGLLDYPEEEDELVWMERNKEHIQYDQIFSFLTNGVGATPKYGVSKSGQPVRTISSKISPHRPPFGLCSFVVG